MFEKMIKFFKSLSKKEEQGSPSKDTAKERLHLVLMQDRANVSADFLELMKQEIIEVIKKYIDIDEKSIDVRLTNKQNEDGTTGAPALYANIPILNVRNDMKKEIQKPEEKKEENVEINDAEEKPEKENIDKEEKTDESNEEESEVKEEVKEQDEKQDVEENKKEETQEVKKNK